MGAGDDSRYREMVDEKYENNILFLGRQSNVENIMNICDVGVLTSNIKIHGEGISNTLMEFPALRTSIIATNNGGTRKLLRMEVVDIC